MTIHVNIKHEFNDNGTWRDIVGVSEMSDQNNITAYYVGEGGILQHVKMQRGEESGMFRTKT